MSLAMLSETFHSMMGVIRASNIMTFGSGVFLGMGVEFFKVSFEMNGISFYKVFNEKQLHKELDAYERELLEYYKLAIKSNEQSG